MSKYNRNNYTSFKNYNKQNGEIEKFLQSSYTTQNTSYPYIVVDKNPFVLKNYNTSGVVATSPSYNVGIQDPGLSWT